MGEREPEKTPTKETMVENCTEFVNYTKKGWAVYRCRLCDVECTMTKSLIRHWEGKVHHKKMTGLPTKEPGAVRQPTSKVVPSPSAALLTREPAKATSESGQPGGKRGRGHFVCTECWADHAEDEPCQDIHRRRKV